MAPPIATETPADAPAEPTELEIPEDLRTVEARDDLVAMRRSARAEVQRIGELDDPSAEELARQGTLAKAYKTLSAEIDRRDAEVGDRKAQAKDIIDSLGDDPDADEQPAEGETPAEGDAPAEQPAEPGDAPAEAPAEGALEAVAASSGPIRVPAVAKKPTLNPSLRQIAAHAPGADLPDPRPDVEIYAAADVPDFGPNARLETMDQLVAATTSKATSMGIGNGSFVTSQLARIKRHYPVVLDETTPTAEVEAALKGLIDPALAPGGMEALVAAGGWCAPSQIRYEFFNIADGPTLWDLPRVGISRGGLRWPDSLSLPQFFAMSSAPASGIVANNTMPWLWTETDDIATVTGSGVKLCLRPPCPTFLEKRLELYGICVLAGNLTADAYPELIQHFIRLVMVAHERVRNRRHLALAAAGSTAVTPTSSTVKDVVPTLLGNSELYAIHTREKFGMATDAVIEAVFPSWVRGPMRSDMAKRNGYTGDNQMAVGDALLADWFDARRIRAQFVTDWQTLPGSAGPANTIGAATAPTNWPTTVQSLMYAPGTWFLGGGMSLRLGLMRDSALNAENDHTAEWTEEADFVGMFGHESLLVNHTIEPGGETVVLGSTPATVGP
jgi:hypothetical protein